MSEVTLWGDPTHATFWTGAEQGSLLLQRCCECGHIQHYARPFCLACRSNALEWVPAIGLGTIYSITIVHVKINPDIKTPYAVAIVELDEGPRLLTSVEPAAPIGTRVRLEWRVGPAGPPVPQFTPVNASVASQSAE